MTKRNVEKLDVVFIEHARCGGKNNHHVTAINNRYSIAGHHKYILRQQRQLLTDQCKDILWWKCLQMSEVAQRLLWLW